MSNENVDSLPVRWFLTFYCIYLTTLLQLKRTNPVMMLQSLDFEKWKILEDITNLENILKWVNSSDSPNELVMGQ